MRCLSQASRAASKPSRQGRRASAQRPLTSPPPHRALLRQRVRRPARSPLSPPSAEQVDVVIKAVLPGSTRAAGRVLAQTSAIVDAVM